MALLSFHIRERKASCNGIICKKYKAPAVSRQQGFSLYKLGYKKCRICDIFLDYDGYRCPCCKRILKTRSTTNSNKPCRKFVGI